jgi:hypothetical protein
MQDVAPSGNLWIQVWLKFKRQSWKWASALLRLGNVSSVFRSKHFGVLACVWFLVAGVWYWIKKIFVRWEGIAHTAICMKWAVSSELCLVRIGHDYEENSFLGKTPKLLGVHTKITLNHVTILWLPGVTRRCKLLVVYWLRVFVFPIFGHFSSLTRFLMLWVPPLILLIRLFLARKAESELFSPHSGTTTNAQRTLRTRVRHTLCRHP